VTFAAILTLWTAQNVGAEEMASETTPGPAVLSAYDGRWNQIADDEAEALRLDSIGAAVEEMSWIMRRVASGVLKKSTKPPPKMEFDWDGGSLHQLVGNRDGNRVQRRLVRLNGAPEILVDPRGEDFSSNWIWTKSGLQVNWKQDQAYGSNIYRVEAGSELLFVEHRIHITAISGIEPIIYRSKFERDSLPAVAAADRRNLASGGRDLR
jgi:hypothetical protein